MIYASDHKSGPGLLLPLLLLGVLFLQDGALGQSPAGAPSPAPPTYPTQNYLTLMKENDIITNADIWDEELKIFAANYAFEGIEGVVNGTEESFARAAGGAWMNLSSCATNDTSDSTYTSVATPETVATMWGYPTYDADAMPIVFSWPAIASSIDATDIELTLNTGEKTNPDVASLTPNTELNERSTVVVFGEFGNRIDPGLPDARYVTNVEIVGEMLFVGPDGEIKDARGLTYNPSKSLPYGPNAVGPKLVGAKLNRMAMVIDGEGTGGTAPNPTVYPNDCISVWGTDVEYRLRMFTSGGFSPDGVSSLSPADFEKYFRLHATLPSGETLILNETDNDYQVGNAGTVKILGLADLGLKQDTYDLCYSEDKDNQIDICLAGDEAAIRLITGLELPVGNKTADPTGQYKGLYNPGGPGNDPTPGVNYTVPFTYQLQDVKMALDIPWVISYNSTAPVSAPSPSGSPSSSSSSTRFMSTWTTTTVFNCAIACGLFHLFI